MNYGIQITSPRGGLVGRPITVTGTYGTFLPHGGKITRLQIDVQFGAGGPTFGASFQNGGWQCVGQPAASVGGTQLFQVTATISGRYDQPADRAFDIPLDEMSDQVTLQLIDALPTALTIDAFPIGVPLDVTTAQLPLAFTLAGSAIDPDSHVASVQCALDTGSLDLVENLTGDWSRWQKTFALSVGLHRFTVLAVDAGGHQTQQERFLMVHQTPEPVDPGTASITSWTRIEPHCRDAAMSTSMNARVFDPLWLMARQWQMGEFQAADAGAPVQARVRATSAMVSRYRLGELPAGTNAQALPYDPTRMPLEAMVERRRMQAVDANDPSMLTLAVEAGLHFLRMIESQTLTRSYRAVLIAKFALQPLSSPLVDTTDDATQRFAQTMAGRAPDARRLAAAFRTGGSQVLQDPSLQITAADLARMQPAALAWLAWYDGLFATPLPSDEAWIPARMEYAVTVSGSFSDQPLDQVNLSASRFDNGRLDWSSFDCDLGVNLVSNGDHSFTAITETTVPAPVTFHGAPAVRFWELEDSRLAYGLLPVGPTDLAHMMLMEYAGSYGNDWFVVPLTLPVGSINRVNSLVVTDSFGVSTLLKPIGASGMPRAGFAMWQHANVRRAGSDLDDVVAHNMYFLPPTIGRVLEGAAVEDVVFMRDETANVAWAIERSVESPTEQPRAYSAPAGPAVESAVPAAGAPARYLLSSAVPENWIPLLPVQLRAEQGQIISRLKRGAVLQPDGSQKIHHAQGQVLNAAAPLLLYDEEVPREGVHVTRSRRMARWIDGSTWVWTAFRKQVGRGEGSSGLQFDQLEAGGR